MFILSVRGDGRCLCCVPPCAPEPWLIVLARAGSGAADRRKSERAHSPEGTSRLRPFMNKALSERCEPQAGGDNPGGSSYRTRVFQDFSPLVLSCPAATILAIAHWGVVGLLPYSMMTIREYIYGATGAPEALQRQAGGDRGPHPAPAEFASRRTDMKPVTDGLRPWTSTRR